MTLTHICSFINASQLALINHIKCLIAFIINKDYMNPFDNAYDHSTDLQLIDEALKGSSKSLEQLIKRHQHYIYNKLTPNIKPIIGNT